MIFYTYKIGIPTLLLRVVEGCANSTKKQEQEAYATHLHTYVLLGAHDLKPPKHFSHPSVTSKAWIRF